MGLFRVNTACTCYLRAGSVLKIRVRKWSIVADQIPSHILKQKHFVDFRAEVDLPTSRALKAELGARKIHDVSENRTRSAPRPPTTEKYSKDFGKV